MDLFLESLFEMYYPNLAVPSDQRHTAVPIVNRVALEQGASPPHTCAPHLQNEVHNS